MKKNGFGLPLSGYQISAWLTTFLLCAGFYSLMLPVLAYETLTVHAVLYSLLLVLTMYFGFLATYIDPTDDSVYEERRARERSEPFDFSKFTKICKVCTTHVKLKSKHCGECNRCVDNFDHHCKWLNNCIGNKNYRQFFILIISLELLLIDQTALGIFILAEYFNNHQIRTKAEEIYGLTDQNSPVYGAIVLTITLLSLTVLIALAHLIVLHIWLRLKNMTTYDYILYLRQKEQPSVLPINSISSEGVQLEPQYEPYIISRNDDPEEITMARNRIQRQRLTILQNSLPSTNIATSESKSTLLNQNHDTNPAPKECQSPSESQSLSFIIDVNESSAEEMCMNKYAN